MSLQDTAVKSPTASTPTDILPNHKKQVLLGAAENSPPTTFRKSSKISNSYSSSPPPYAQTSSHSSDGASSEKQQSSASISPHILHDSSKSKSTTDRGTSLSAKSANDRVSDEKSKEIFVVNKNAYRSQNAITRKTSNVEHRTIHNESIPSVKRRASIHAGESSEVSTADLFSNHRDNSGFPRLSWKGAHREEDFKDEGKDSAFAQKFSYFYYIYILCFF